MSEQKARLGIILGILALCLCAACGAPPPGETAQDATVIPVDTAVVEPPDPLPPDLAGTPWIWSHGLPGVEVIAMFEQGTVSGSAGCNTYQGGYSTDSQEGTHTIQTSSLAATSIACDQSIMDLEAEFLTALESATGYDVADNVLTLVYPGGMLLFYDGHGPKPLAGPTWVWDFSMPAIKITAKFHEGRVVGFGGCNPYQGGYSTGREGDLDTIQFSPLTSTLVNCNSPIITLEMEFLTWLEAATSYQIDGSALEIATQHGPLYLHDQAGPER